MLFLPNITTSPSQVALQIADRGVRALVKVLDSDNVVTFLNLQDNQVSYAADAIRLSCMMAQKILQKTFWQ